MSNEPKPQAHASPSPPDQLLWLADAPLFVDSKAISSFYEAVVAPDFYPTKMVVSAKSAFKLMGTAEVGANIDFGPLAKFFGLDAGLHAKGKADGEGDSEDSQTREYTPVVSPQRQLLLLALHYVNAAKGRYKFVQDPSESSWRDETFISAVPRSLIFLELPSQSQATSPRVPTMLIPTAVEIEGTGVIELYSQMPGTAEAGQYPEPKPSEDAETLRKSRSAYWKVYQQHFSATRAMQTIEKKVGGGKILWIDYRLPINDQGDTLHLHFVPSGKYDTGVFAYNLIKRGFKHGLRLVGTLKSEPDLNVLAVFDR